MKRLAALLMCTSLAAFSGCGPTEEPEPEDNEITKAEAAELAGKGDHVDWCAVLDWYGDGICDDFCQNPDPDCVETCTSDADCADGYCEHFASCLSTDCPPPPPPQCVTADCDDGSSLHPLCDMRPVCEAGEVAAVINGCFECRDARTCEAPDQPDETCDDGTQVNPFCDIRETCDDGLVSVVQNGCFVCVDPDTCEAPSTGGQMCGGIAGLQCPEGQTCQMDAGTCNIADNAGTCVPTPEACPEIYAPVCGCDGTTYSSSCDALAAGATVDHDGECQDDGGDEETLCGGFLGDTCADDEYCAYQAGQYCGAADASATCMTRPEFCTAVYDPVCGCDGRTYSNGCQAAASGTGVFSEGPCQN